LPAAAAPGEPMGVGKVVGAPAVGVGLGSGVGVGALPSPPPQAARSTARQAAKRKAVATLAVFIVVRPSSLPV
jgi:hypothetical protein